MCQWLLLSIALCSDKNKNKNDIDKNVLEFLQVCYMQYGKRKNLIFKVEKIIKKFVLNYMEFVYQLQFYVILK